MKKLILTMLFLMVASTAYAAGNWTVWYDTNTVWSYRARALNVYDPTANPPTGDPRCPDTVVTGYSSDVCFEIQWGASGDPEIPDVDAQATAIVRRTLPSESVGKALEKKSHGNP